MISRLSPFLLFILIFYSLVCSTSGTLYLSPFRLPLSKRYDFIIVGGQHFSRSICPVSLWWYTLFTGGAGGSVIASRLTEDPGTSVLVIEAGSRYTCILIFTIGCSDWHIWIATSGTLKLRFHRMHHVLPAPSSWVFYVAHLVWSENSQLLLKYWVVILTSGLELHYLASAWSRWSFHCIRSWLRPRGIYRH